MADSNGYQWGSRHDTRGTTDTVTAGYMPVSTLTRQLNSLAGRITSNVTLEYSLLERRESTVHAHGSGETRRFPLYMEIVRMCDRIKKDCRV